MGYFSCLIYSRGVKRAVMSFTVTSPYGDDPQGEEPNLPLTALELVREFVTQQAASTGCS